MNENEIMDVLPLLLPLFLVWLVMLIAGLSDLIRRKRTKGPKWVWYIVVVFFSILGPVVYFLFGRDET